MVTAMMATLPTTSSIVPLDMGKVDSSDSSIWYPLISPVARSTCTVAVFLLTSTSTRNFSPSNVAFFGRIMERLYPRRLRKPSASRVTRSASSRLFIVSVS